LSVDCFQSKSNLIVSIIHLVSDIVVDDVLVASGLKNAGDTYWRTLDTIFQGMVGQELEMYIDDIVIMAQFEEPHVLNLRKEFKRMRQHKFQIHPLKCAFGVSTGKELGFHSF
jgi:hypothetical protein